MTFQIDGAFFLPGEDVMKVDAYFFLVSRRSTKHGGWGFAILHMILKALLVDDALQLPSVISS